MADVSDETFFAWLDGELTPEEAARVAAAVAADPALAARAEEHRALAARLRGAFDPVAREPMRLPSAPVVSFAEARAACEARTAPPLWKQVAAMAATLALGIFAGNQLIGESSSPVQPEAGRLVAAAALEDALYTRLASAPAEEGPRIGLTFRDPSGTICRTFTDVAASGLACHEGGDWRIRGLFQAPEGQAGEYRMAAGADPNLAALVDETIAGEPFDAEQEKTALEQGWRRLDQAP